MARPTTTGGGGILGLIERVGNALPDPVTLFLGGAILVMVLSAVGARAGWSVEKPLVRIVMQDVLDTGTGKPVAALSVVEKDRRPVLITDADGNPLPKPVREPVLNEKRDLVREEGVEVVKARSLLSRDGLHWVFDNLVKNFTGFHPLGVVLVAMLGIGVAEKVGLIGALLKAMVLITPSRLLTPAMVMVGIISSLAADAGYVVLPPLAAALYKAVGRSPLAGMAAVFAGVSAGFSANFIITSLDPLLSGLAQEGARILDPSYVVAPTCNWYFMIVSTIVLTMAGWFVTARFVEPRYANKPADQGGPSTLTAEEQETRHLSPGEIRGLRISGVTLVLALAACLALIFLPGAPLNTPAGETTPRWSNAIVPMLLFCFIAPGIAYGMVCGTILSETGAKRLDGGVARLMGRSMADMGPYIVLAFFAAQFVAFFNYSNLGIMLAIVGGEALAAASLPPWALMALFIVVAMVGNLFIGSASAKFAFFAPVFIPMFMRVGISPELTQAAYRVGDSVTNIITPLNPYFVVILVFMQRYFPKGGIGTLVAMMLPYTIVFWIIWTILLIGWMLLGIPLGPAGPLTYTPPGA